MSKTKEDRWFFDDSHRFVYRSFTIYKIRDAYSISKCNNKSKLWIKNIYTINECRELIDKHWAAFDNENEGII